jgi:hypothetical protein
VKILSNRVKNSRQKNNSVEDGIYETNGLFRKEIPAVPQNRKLSEFRSKIPRKRKMLRIPDPEK